jgi:hypothetical protein
VSRSTPLNPPRYAGIHTHPEPCPMSIISKPSWSFYFGLVSSFLPVLGSGLAGLHHRASFPRFLLASWFVCVLVSRVCGRPSKSFRCPPSLPPKKHKVARLPSPPSQLIPKHQPANNNQKHHQSKKNELTGLSSRYSSLREPRTHLDTKTTTATPILVRGFRFVIHSYPSTTILYNLKIFFIMDRIRL